jgi:hypothetical protein
MTIGKMRRISIVMTVLLVFGPAPARHASAKTTLDTYSHLLPHSDESTRTAVEKVLSQRLVGSSLHRRQSR